jgi:hypothetical protein
MWAFFLMTSLDDLDFWRKKMAVAITAAASRTKTGIFFLAKIFAM